MANDDDASFRHLVLALQPFSNDLVIVGGWAHRLYRYMPQAIIPPHEPLFTIDTDIAIPSDAHLSEKAIDERLRAHGFIEEFSSDDHPPVTHYRLGDEDSGFYAEFLTPLAGSPKQHTTELGGVVAQRLRHLDILLIEPWRVQIDDVDSSISVQVANPVAYIAQKLLIVSKRSKPADRGKDLLYVHDTLELFADSLDELAALWENTIRPRLGGAANEVERRAPKYFEEITDDIRRAARMAEGRGLDAETIRIACGLGLETIFGIKI
jgi:hypothetical protein